MLIKIKYKKTYFGLNKDIYLHRNIVQPKCIFTMDQNYEGTFPITFKKYLKTQCGSASWYGHKQLAIFVKKIT